MDLKGYHVGQVLVEEAVDFTDELYVGITMDRGAGKPVAMVSTKGGVDIEEVAEEDPDAIAQEHIDPSFGMHPYQARKAVYDAGVDSAVARDVSSVLTTLYDLWTSRDGSDAEINPLMVTDDDEVIAADAVMNIDEDALFRQPELAEMEEEAASGDELEQKADEYDFDYVRLEGNTGIIGNGAGLVMTTLDLVDHYGGEPANFLDVGGGAKADRIANALDMVFSDDNVDSVVFNIFGGITRGDEVAKGINEALEQFDEIPKPVVVPRWDELGRRDGDSQRGPRDGRTDPRGCSSACRRVRCGGGSMSVLVDDETRVVVQGITGGEGKFHAEQMIEYGTNVVAGAVPGKGGQEAAGVPVYDTVDEAVEAEDADTSVIFVPPAFAGDAIFEALDTDLELAVAITEGIPTQDMARVNKRLTETDTRLIGPNCPGSSRPARRNSAFSPATSSPTATSGWSPVRGR